MNKKIKQAAIIAIGAIMALSVISCAKDDHEHTFDDKWTFNDTHHYHAATCGHNVSPEESDGYAEHNIVNGECSVCDYYIPVTVNMFTTTYKTVADELVKSKIRPSVVENKQVKSEYCYFVDNSDNTLAKVTFVWTYEVSPTERAVEITKVSLETALSFKNIIDGNYSLTPSELSVDRTPIFTFDAKENGDNKNLASALFEKAELDGNTKLYKEVEGDETFRAFELFAQADDEITIVLVKVKKGDGTDAALFANLDSEDTTVETKELFIIDGTKLYGDAYSIENI